MNIDQGMNVAEVRALGETLKASADKVDTQMRALDKLVGSAGWVGPTAVKFKIQWWPSHRSTMARMVVELREFGRSAAANADEQVEASRAAVNPVAGSWFDGRVQQDISNSISGAGDVKDLYTFFKDYDVLKKLKGFEDLLHRSPVKIGFLDVIGTGWDASKLFDAIHRGSLDGGIRSGLDVGFDVGGVAFPVIGLAKGAWDIGWDIGKATDWLIGEKLGGHQSFINSVIQDQYGGSLTPSEAADLSHRYDGVSGFGNFVMDNARNTGEVATSLWKKVFG